MKQQYFLIDLKQPVIISGQAATAGAHQSLDYISGSAILGLSAGKLYAQLSVDEAFTVFHSGKVRFLNALPVVNDEVALPVPMSLHNFKGESYEQDGQLLDTQVFDISKFPATELNNRQAVQLRSFYVTHSGQKITPSKEQTLKTAINKQHNRAEEGQLFGYEALSSGQQFGFSIQADDDVDDTLVQKVIDSLQGVAHLGRSRSSQFGKVKISKADTPSKDSPKQDSILTLWLISDMCLHDHGQATLLIKPESVGLPKGTIWLSSQSFVRTRRYSSFNNYRKHYDKERQVITQGSILRFDLPQGADFNAICQKLHQGIGLYTEQGLGQVVINPSILQDVYPVWQKGVKKIANQTQVVQQPNSLLIRVLQKRATFLQTAHEQKHIANEIFIALCEKIGFARRFHGVADKANFQSVNQQAPSRTQFGGLKDLANRLRDDKNGLWQELSNSTNGFLYVKNVHENDNRQSGKSYINSGWDLKFGTKADDNLGTFLLKEQLNQYKDEDYFPQIVAELAVFAMSSDWEQCCLGLGETQKGSES